MECKDCVLTLKDNDWSQVFKGYICPNCGTLNKEED